MLDQLFFIVPPVPEALISRQHVANIDLNVSANRGHPEIDLIAIQRFETAFDLWLLLTSDQQMEVIKPPPHNSFDNAQDVAPFRARTLVESIQNNICVRERPAQF